MDKLAKFLKKLGINERKTVLRKLDLLKRRKIKGLDIRKVKNTDYFRLRTGKNRVVFYYKNKRFILVSIRRKDKDTYKKFNS